MAMRASALAPVTASRTAAPFSTFRELSIVSRAMTREATTFTPIGPIGTKEEKYWAKAMATAAMEPAWMTQKQDQP